MDFADTSYLALLAVPAALTALYVGYWRWKRRAMTRAGDPALLEAMSESRSARAEVASFVLVAVALGLLVAALAGPQWGEKKEQVRRQGIDVVFAVDISRSMTAEDVPPSRLEAARAEITRLLGMLDGDRVGLVGFAGIAYAQCPLTTDYSALRTFLDQLDPDAMPVQGTAIGRAIRESINLLTGTRGEDPGALAAARNEGTRGRDQLIVVFTDGEDQETRPDEAAAEALALGIRVYTVPIGTAEGAEIPIFGRDGTRVRSLTDRAGQVVVSRVDEEALTSVAEAGGGLVLPYRGEGSIAGSLDQEIDRMQSAEIDEILRPERAERFYFFVAPALALLFVAMALTDRRRRLDRAGWLGVVLLSLVLPALGGCDDTFVYEADEVAEAHAQSEAGSTAAGLDAIRGFRAEMALDDLLDPRALDYNEALALARAGQTDEARRLFIAALGSPDPEIQFRSQYNLGNLAFGEEEYDGALDRYRRALSLRPGDEDAQWNLEVTLRRLFPPCLTFEDDFEENDRPEEASPLELPADAAVQPPPDGEDTAPKRVVCGGDADFYRLEEVLPGARVTAEVSFERLREDAGGAALPDRIPRNSVRVTLYAGDGTTVLDTDAGQAEATDGETDMNARRFTRTLRHVEVPPGSAPSGTVYLEVDANLGLEYEYDVEVSVWPPCAAAEDEHEENDTRAQAARLEPGDQALMICGEDDDWFRLSVEPGDSVFFDLQPGPDQGLDATRAADAAESAGEEPEAHSVALRAELYLPGETEPTDLSWGRDGLLELAALDILTAGELFVRVTAMLPDGQGPYTLHAARFAPCIVGDDEHEENDALEAAAAVPIDQGPIRHLRLCADDDDWYQVALTEDEHFSVGVEWVEPERHVALALVGGPDGRVVAYGTPVEAPETAERGPDELTPPPPRARFQQSIHIEEPDSGAHQFRVNGEPGFYNIVFPDPNSDQSCDNPQEGDDGEPQDQPPDGEPDEGDPQENDSPPEGEPGDESRAEPDGEAGDEQQQAEPEQQPEGEPEGEVDQNSALSDAEMSDQEAAHERLRERLEALAAEQDRNLQLERALDNIQPIQVERQW